MVARAVTAVALGGLVAGAIDITYAWAFWAVKAGTTPTRILQSVTAGLLGAAAFDGGQATALLGLALHFGIALTIAAVYCAGAARFALLVRRPWTAGLLYGVAVYVVMNRIVVPLSAAGPASHDPLWITLSLLVHALGVGVPCALAARKALDPQAAR